MARTILALGLAAFGLAAPGCMTAADLDFLGMGTRPRATEVVQTRKPLLLEVERPAGATPAEPKPSPNVFSLPAPVPGPRPAPFGYASRRDRLGLPAPLQPGMFRRPWRRSLGFGLPTADGSDLRWSVRGAGRGGFGLPDDPPPPLSFGLTPVPATPVDPSSRPKSQPQPKFSDG